MARETIQRTDHDEGIVRISLDRPESHNAQNPQLLDELVEAMKEVEQEDDSRVVILDGNGPSFSSGHDLQRGDEEDAEWTVERRLEFEEKYYRGYSMKIRELNLPTIAQVHGYCGAGGMMLTSVCDLVISAADAEFANPVNRMAAAGLELLLEPWEVGFRKAKEIMWTGDSISGEEAEKLGMVNRAVSGDELDDETMMLAKKIARMPPFAVQLSKKSFIFMRDEMGYDATQRYHLLAHQLSHASREWDDWHAKGDEIAEEEGFGGWLSYRDDPFDINR